MKIPIQITKLGEDESYHLFVDLIINQVPLHLLIDTGASKSVISTKTSQLLGEFQIKETEHKATSVNANQLNTQIIRYTSFTIQSLQITDIDIAIMDLSFVNNTYSELDISPIEGILGCDLLVKLNAQLFFEDSLLLFKAF